MASGFTKPSLGLIGSIIVGLAFPSRLLMIVWIVIIALLFTVGESYSRYIARRQTTQWCRSHGYGTPRWIRRGGFVSWGWSFWSFSELMPCEFDDSTGTTHNVLVDLYAPMFGFWVQSRILRNVNEEFSPTTSG